MAKMFYTMEETKAALGRTEEEIRQLAREGRLREFRDGARLMFKADQVEQLKAELSGSGDALNIAPDTDAPIGLADSRTGAGPAKDLGISSGLAGISPGKVAPPPGSGLGNLPGSGVSALSGSGLSSGARGTGITIFDVDDSQKADPSAQTVIAPGVKDKINLESVGSGSGLLDLTREPDDTSLGAVFDEVAPKGPPGAARGAAPGLPERVEDEGAEVRAGALRQAAAPVYVEAPDPLGTALGAASLVAAAVLCFGGFILAAVLLGYRPDILNNLQWEKDGKMYLAGAFGVSAVVAAIGYIVGKAGARK